MIEWFRKLDRSSANALLGGGVIAAAVLVYSLLWAPLNAAVARLQQEVPRQQALLGWMQGASRELGKLKTASETTVPLVSIVSSSAERSGLAAMIKEIRPEGETRVRVILHSAGFDDLLRWVHELSVQHGAVVSELSAAADASPGRVDVRLTLVFGGPG